jgi:hypothetical protein
MADPQAYLADIYEVEPETVEHVILLRLTGSARYLRCPRGSGPG